MSAPVKLATENGRRVGRISKAKRLAAQPAADTARLLRSVDRILEELERIDARRDHARDVLDALLAAIASGDKIVTRALAHEAHVEIRHALNVELAKGLCALVREGKRCA